MSSHRVSCLASIGALLVAALFANEAQAYCRMTTGGGSQIGNVACVERGEPFFWQNPCLSYSVDSRGSAWFGDVSEIEALVDQSFATWQDTECDGNGSTPNLVFKPLQQSTCRRAEFNTTGNVNTIAFLDPWRDPCADPDDPDDAYDPFAFAVTIVWHNTSTGQIFDADMMINDQRTTRFNAGGPYADCPPTGCPAGTPSVPGPADLRSIVTHEIGHFIGIGHSNIEEATMFSMADRESVGNRTLAPDDINAVCDIYPPGNLTSECNAAPMGGLQLNCETDGNGDAIACDEPGAAPSSNSGCACSTNDPRVGSWLILLAAFVTITSVRRRSNRRAARS